MKNNNIKILFFLLLVIAISCEDKAEKKSEIQKQVEVKKISTKLKHSTPKKKLLKKLPKKKIYYETKFVSARSGLQYRARPKGNVLGKFPLNTSLEIIDYPKTKDQIKDGNKILKGEWVGVKKDLDTVYVFNGFLSYEYTYSDIILYEVSPYSKEQDGTTRTAFLNLSETYFINSYDTKKDKLEELLVTEDDFDKDTIRFNKTQRKKLLKKLKLTENDKVFVYQIKNDRVLTFNIKDLPAIACVNIYASGNYQDNPESYEYGFDLGKKINTYGNLVYVGKSNPFQTGKLKPIIWTKIENKEFPDNKKLKDHSKTTSYIFATTNYNYYLQSFSSSSEHIVIVSNKTKTEVFNKYFYDSEGAYLQSLTIAGNKNKEQYQEQWAGKLFKNKATVVFGFMGYSFGCPSITVLDKTEPLIEIRCDNRH